MSTPIREMIALHPTDAVILVQAPGAGYDPRAETDTGGAYVSTAVKGLWNSANQSNSGQQFTGTLTVETVPDGILVDSTRCVVGGITYIVRAMRQRRWEREIAGYTLELGI